MASKPSADTQQETSQSEGESQPARSTGGRKKAAAATISPERQAQFADMYGSENLASSPKEAKEKRKYAPAFNSEEESKSAPAATITPMAVPNDALREKKEKFISEVVALGARLGLLTTAAEIRSPVSRKIFAILARAVAQPDQWNKPVNRLAALGEGYWHAYLVDILFNRFPVLPGVLLSSMVSSMRSPEKIQEYANSLGLNHFNRNSHKISEKLLYSVLMAVQEIKGEDAARRFVNRFVQEELSRVNPADSIIIEDPKAFVVSCLNEAQMEPLRFELVKESGRATSSPTFVVNAYSGMILIGTGTGASLNKARSEACRNALNTQFAKPSSEYVKAILDSSALASDALAFPKAGLPELEEEAKSK